MELPSKEVLALMKSKGVDYLYHANTVRTTCTFLRTGYLLARGIVHERGLDQTPQKSDAAHLDRALGIWYDLFFDSCDIQVRSGQHNEYGPVLCFDLALLEQDWMPSIWVTKDNPIRWSPTTSAAKRWFTSIDELKKSYNRYTFAQHAVLRNVAGSIRLLPYLKAIILDNPERGLPRTPSVDIHSQAAGALQNALRAGGLQGKGIRLASRKSHSLYKKVIDDDIYKLFSS
jgi:hypothetical protein